MNSPSEWIENDSAALFQLRSRKDIEADPVVKAMISKGDVLRTRGKRQALGKQKAERQAS